MTEFPPPAGSPAPSAWTTPAPFPPTQDSAPARLPFSKWTIFGFVFACISLFVVGFLGGLGFVLSARGLRDARRGIVRGRGLAIAGMVIGLVAFAYYVIAFIMRVL